MDYTYQGTHYRGRSQPLEMTNDYLHICQIGSHDDSGDAGEGSLLHHLSSRYGSRLTDDQKPH